MKPCFGQVLGFIQEGEPLALDLPNRNASIYTSSHLYLDNYPNAPEPVSETPLPHTTLNPAAAFETADEGYDGVPFPQQLRRQPQVYRIDTDSESEPQAQPQQQIRARPIRRQGQGRQQPTPFGINQVPIPVSSDTDRISRQSRSDRGPLGTQGSARPFAQPSFDALRQASEPEAA